MALQPQVAPLRSSRSQLHSRRRQAERQTGRETDRQRERRAERERGRQADRGRDEQRETDRLNIKSGGADLSAAAVGE